MVHSSIFTYMYIHFLLTINKMNIDIIYFLLPAIICYATTAFCKIGKNAGVDVKFRPPPQIFGIVWPILFILFGLSWAVAMRNCQNKIVCFATYMLTTISLALWIYIYGCKKSNKGGAWVLILCLTLTLMCFAQGNYVSKVLVAPLIAWCIFAQLMNTAEVQNS
jgi:benzodiazapine receptor